MSGSNSSLRAGLAAEVLSPRPLCDEPLALTVHGLPVPDQASLDRAGATRKGRWRMLLVFLVCAAPVLASYLTYYVVRPEGRRNYGELIESPRLVPVDLVATDAEGRRVPLASLKRQWLFVSVADSTCDSRCERHLYLQRQLREGLGKNKERLDWVWLRTGDGALSEPLRQATATATVLQVPESELARWLQPAAGHRLADHLYVVDPMGNWMLRFPVDADPARMRRDLENLLRASAGWDQPGR
ncbi:MAG TPA: hypothetical protein VFY31_07270 [Macromonas sp.]|nr:hypothetical protein [Macromonas sp.]